jgi:hypothetical protein
MAAYYNGYRGTSLPANYDAKRGASLTACYNGYVGISLPLNYNG